MDRRNDLSGKTATGENKYTCVRRFNSSFSLYLLLVSGPWADGRALSRDSMVSSHFAGLGSSVFRAVSLLSLMVG